MPGHWKPVAEALIENYKLDNDSSVLDVGCGKAYLLHEMKLILPGLRVVGFDISNHGLSDSRPEIRDNLFIARAQDAYKFNDDEFDLVISLGCLHNLHIYDLKKSHVFGASITKVLKSKDGIINIWGHGKEKRDFLFVDSMVGLM